MQQPIDKINLSVRNGRGKVIQNGSTVNLMIDLPRAIHSGGGGLLQFAEVTVALSHASVNEYTVQKINNLGEKDGVNITIDRALGYEGFGTDATDIRYFAPWFGVGAIIKICKHFDDEADEIKWFIDMPMLFIGKPADRSLDIDEVTTAGESLNRVMAVWK